MKVSELREMSLEEVQSRLEELHVNSSTCVFSM